jgi:hypothetical protein
LVQFATLDIALWGVTALAAIGKFLDCFTTWQGIYRIGGIVEGDKAWFAQWAAANPYRLLIVPTAITIAGGAANAIGVAHNLSWPWTLPIAGLLVAEAVTSFIAAYKNNKLNKATIAKLEAATIVKATK